MEEICIYPRHSRMLHRGFSPVVAGRGVLLQLNHRAWGMFAFVGWRTEEKKVKTEPQRRRNLRRTCDDFLPITPCYVWCDLTEWESHRSRRTRRLTRGGGGKSELPTLEDGTGVRDAVKNLPVLISVLIHNAWLAQHMYFSQSESTAVFQLPTEAISRETTDSSVEQIDVCFSVLLL